MFKVNEYYEGKVKSISFESTEGPASIGIMDAGEYEFTTSNKEIMTITSGSMKVLLPGKQEWQEYNQNESFEVEPGKTFMVQVLSVSTYLCEYR